MKADKYTKVVLTVIAACLVWLSLGGPSLLQTAHAQSTQPVLIAGWVDTKGQTHHLPVTVVDGMPVAVVYSTR